MAHCNPTSELTNGVPGGDTTLKDKILETGASVAQNFAPVKGICAYLNAYHAYASDPTRTVEANHYCTHLSADVRQCLIYDAPTNPARLIGVEYMVTPKIYDTFDEEEKKLWHTHVHEVKSGLLVMPQNTMPEALWETAETKEMEEVIGLYGKTFHFWQVDRGDIVPLGKPELMVSFMNDSQVPWDKVEERDARLGISWQHKKSIREHIPEPERHGGADDVWQSVGK